jgi:hypothetical protein
MLATFVLDSAGEPQEEPDLAEAYGFYQSMDRMDPAWRCLKATALVDATGRACKVSTIFLGLAPYHKVTKLPTPYQTIIFGGERDSQCRRWHTRGEAEEGHDALVALISAEALAANGDDELLV